MRAAARRGMWRFGLVLLVAPVGAAGPLVGCGEAGPGPTAVKVDPAAGVALLAVVEGQVKVRREDGIEIAAAADMSLARTDTVITSPGALVVVVLANGYVIKLEEDQATPVRALAHLDDPPASESVAELFEKALGAEAFARVGGADRLERIAGWNARRASGETPAPVAKSAAPPPVAEAPAATAPIAAPEAEDAGAGPALDAKREEIVELDGAAENSRGSSASKAGRAPTRRPLDDADDEAPPKPSKKKDSQTEGAKPVPSAEAPGAPPPPPQPAPQSEPESKKAPAPDLVESWSFEPGDGKHVSKTRLPALLSAQRRALAECLTSALPGVAAPVLRLRIAGGVVQEVALGGGGSVPACAKGLLDKALPEAGADGWVVVRARR